MTPPRDRATEENGPALLLITSLYVGALMILISAITNADLMGARPTPRYGTVSE